MYRPQFPFACPLMFEDADFIQYFDYRNTPLLNNTTLAAATAVLNIGLNLDADGPFFLRGIQVLGQNRADPVIQVQFKDPSGNYLSDQFVGFDEYVAPNATGQFIQNIVFEPEIACPPATVFWMNLYNQTAGNADLTKVRVSLYGVKRALRKGVKCAA